ncbi:MAG: tRNA pseudouridine(38-40) synthase TruA [Armatimonadetes bacterium]|nr:tRNA pseudouridine(38-40) synthase TruA [Armatimonadota bacterium]
MARRHIRLDVQYDGTNYAGFCIQPGVPTIQGEMETALGKLLGEPVHLVAASRTDAGVHALGQVVAFFTERRVPVGRFPQALNDLLPRDIAVVAAAEVPEDFHPRFDAIGKLYTYRILNRPVRSPIICRYAWHVSEPLDLRAMRRAAEALVGEKDFAAFCAAGGAARTTVRNLYRLDLDTNADVIELRLGADGFLYMMARIIVGTLVEVGLGRRHPAEMDEILASRDRRRAGKTAPPEGLCLVRVDY